MEEQYKEMIIALVNNIEDEGELEYLYTFIKLTVEQLL